jgi:predicted DNA-binding WGR domain protein
VSDDQVLDELVERAVSRGVVMELVDPVPGRGQRCRFYAVHVQPTLLEPGADVVRSWGRIGRVHRPRQQCTHEWDETGIRSTLRAVLARRLRRGYRC